ncbi:hypothetical protein QBC35DRAFT_475796 [Podospora australis]|uniref:Uncharacterized protein n=1 Tax=Podospora australis TaxID=1536484 RepID=A0AAN6WPZ7_9PEZI|nr:hypothetical protein QBC35DRAFT_475796 [Podospora australis]
MSGNRDDDERKRWEEKTAEMIREAEGVLGDVGRGGDYPLRQARTNPVLGPSALSPPPPPPSPNRRLSPAAGAPVVPTRSSSLPRAESSPAGLPSRPSHQRLPPGPSPLGAYTPLIYDPPAPAPAPAPAAAQLTAGPPGSRVVGPAPPPPAGPAVAGGGAGLPAIGTDHLTPDNPFGYPAPPPFRRKGHNWERPNLRAARGAVQGGVVNRVEGWLRSLPVGSRPRKDGGGARLAGPFEPVYPLAEGEDDETAGGEEKEKKKKKDNKEKE